MGGAEDRVRERAYAIWQAEGEPHGRAAAHWARAEAEIGSGIAAGGPVSDPADGGVVDGGDPPRLDAKSGAMPSEIGLSQRHPHGQDEIA